MADLLDNERYVIFDGLQQYNASGTRYFSPEGMSTESKAKAAKFLTITDAIVFAKHHEIPVNGSNSIGREEFNQVERADDLPTL